jgi:hypothetical protein
VLRFLSSPPSCSLCPPALSLAMAPRKKIPKNPEKNPQAQQPITTVDCMPEYIYYLSSLTIHVIKLASDILPNTSGTHMIIIFMIIPIQVSLNYVEADPHVLRKASSKQPRMLFNSLCVCVAYCILEMAAHTTTRNTTKSSSGASTQGMLSTNFTFLKSLQSLYGIDITTNVLPGAGSSVPTPAGLYICHHLI